MKHIYVFISMLFLLYPAFAQTGEINGRVVNAKNNEPIPFANLIIEGSTTGATSDIDGVFAIKNVKPGYYQLVASSVGFEKFITGTFLVTNSKAAFVEIAMIETVINLSGVEIKTKTFERKEESPLSMRTLGIQEIEKNPGGNRDISKVIQSLPGVAATPAYRNDVIVRGGGSGENRFYLDDVEIPNLNHFATQGTSGGPAGMINTDFLREVEFYSGSFPASRGNALSSIVDMKLIDGSKDKTNFKLTLGASDYGLTVDGPIGKKTTYLISARRSYLKLLFTLLELPFLPTYNDFQVKAKISLSKKDQLTFIGLGAIDQFKLNLKANETDQQRYILSYIPVNDQWNYAVGAVYKHFRKNSYDTWVLSRNFLNNTSYKYRNNDESSKDNLTFNYKSQEIENKLRYENTIRQHGWKIIYGAGVEYTRYNNSTFQKFYINNTAIEKSYESALDLFKWNVFVQTSKSFIKERLLVTIGARSDGNSYSREMSNMIEQLSPRIAVSWAFTNRWSMNLNVGRYAQQPPYTTLGFRNPEGELVNKNNGIRYITADHAVAGFGYTDNTHIQLTVEGFYKSYKKYPFSVNDSISIASKGADFGTYGDEEVTSDSKGMSYGGELLFRLNQLKGFSVIGTYTYVRSMFTGADGKWIPSAWDNRHLVNLTVSKNFKRNWYLGIKWKYLGGAPYTPWDLEQSAQIAAWDVRGRAYPDYDLFNTGRLTSYHQLDMRADKEWYFKKWSLNLYVDIQNIYNSKAIGPDNYILATDADGKPIIDPDDPGRYVLKAIPNEAGTIVPTLGIIIQI